MKPSREKKATSPRRFPHSMTGRKPRCWRTSDRSRPGFPTLSTSLRSFTRSGMTAVIMVHFNSSTCLPPTTALKRSPACRSAQKISVILAPERERSERRRSRGSRPRRLIERRLLHAGIFPFPKTPAPAKALRRLAARIRQLSPSLAISNT